jgi:diketogulonate reductase-like aldo/keto reductase
VQTKYSPPRSQDPGTEPYDPSAKIEEQLDASVETSLRNLATPDAEPYLDCLVLHSPLQTLAATYDALVYLHDKYVPTKIRHLGLSNVPSTYVAHIGPGLLSVVQNRFHPETAWEVGLRAYCRHSNIVFQAFWILTGNPQLANMPFVSELAESAGVSIPVAIYALTLGLQGVSVLDGTADEAHMREDVEGIAKIREWAMSEGQEIWYAALSLFQGHIREC